MRAMCRRWMKFRRIRGKVKGNCLPAGGGGAERRGWTSKNGAKNFNFINKKSPYKTFHQQ